MGHPLKQHLTTKNNLFLLQKSSIEQMNFNPNR